MSSPKKIKRSLRVAKGDGADWQFEIANLPRPLWQLSNFSFNV